MGILTRQQEKTFVITSDRPFHAESPRLAPRRLNDSYLVWTGAHWSASKSEAITFASLDDADDYVRANFVKITTCDKASH